MTKPMTGTELPRSSLATSGYPSQRVSLVDLLDRVLAGGVVVTGEITLSIADVDLVVVSLRALLTSVSTLVKQGGEAE
jgi:Gas vesicle protein